MQLPYVTLHYAYSTTLHYSYYIHHFTSEPATSPALAPCHPPYLSCLDVGQFLDVPNVAVKKTWWKTQNQNVAKRNLKISRRSQGITGTIAQARDQLESALEETWGTSPCFNLGHKFIDWYTSLDGTWMQMTCITELLEETYQSIAAHLSPTPAVLSASHKLVPARAALAA